MSGTDHRRDPGGGDAPHDLVGAYALDALDDVERARFERHLTSCASCRTELAGLQAAAAALGQQHAEQPPPALRDRVLAAIAEDPSQHAAPPASPSPAGQRLRRVVRRALAVAAAVVVAALLTLNWLSPFREPLDEIRAAALEGDRARIDELLDAHRDDLDVDDVVTDAGVQARLIASDDESVLLTGGLPALPPDRTYQAWVIDEDGPRSAGVLGPGADPVGTVGAVGEGVEAVAVSVEPAGGSEQPGDDIVVVVPTA